MSSKLISKSVFQVDVSNYRLYRRRIQRLSHHVHHPQALPQKQQINPRNFRMCRQSVQFAPDSRKLAERLRKLLPCINVSAVARTLIRWWFVLVLHAIHGDACLLPSISQVRFWKRYDGVVAEFIAQFAEGLK